MKHCLVLAVMTIGSFSYAAAQSGSGPGQIITAGGQFIGGQMGMPRRIHFVSDETSLSINLNMNIRVGTSMSADDREAALEKAQHTMLKNVQP